MPRKLTAKTTLDSIEDEIVYTRAALKADPDTADLVTLTDSWHSLLEGVKSTERQVETLTAEVDAQRLVANDRLDRLCLDFSEELLRSCGRNRSSPRFTTYFPSAPSAVVRQPLGQQLDTVRGWLSVTTEPTLEPFRADLTWWVGAADSALSAGESLSVQRGQLRQLRESLASELTAERDALHRALAERATQKGFARTWPDLFFKVGPTTGKDSATSDQSATPA